MDSSNHLDEGSISSSIKKGKKAKAKEVTNVQLPSYNLFQSQNGINIVLKECVRRDLFPKLNFLIQWMMQYTGTTAIQYVMLY